MLLDHGTLPVVPRSSGRPDAAGRVASSHGRGESAAGPRASGAAPCGGEAGGCLASEVGIP